MTTISFADYVLKMPLLLSFLPLPLKFQNDFLRSGWYFHFIAPFSGSKYSKSEDIRTKKRFGMRLSYFLLAEYLKDKRYQHHLSLSRKDISLLPFLFLTKSFKTKWDSSIDILCHLLHGSYVPDKSSNTKDNISERILNKIFYMKEKRLMGLPPKTCSIKW